MNVMTVNTEQCITQFWSIKLNHSPTKIGRRFLTHIWLFGVSNDYVWYIWEWEESAGPSPCSQHQKHLKLKTCDFENVQVWVTTHEQQSILEFWTSASDVGRWKKLNLSAITLLEPCRIHIIHNTWRAKGTLFSYDLQSEGVCLEIECIIRRCKSHSSNGSWWSVRR